MIRLGRIRRDPTISEHGPSSSSVEPQRDPSLFLVELERGLSSSSSFPIEPQNGSSSSITISLSSSTTLSDKPDYEIISEGVKKQTLPSARTKHRTQYLHEWEKKPELTLDRFSSDLATQYPFINYIIARALIIINHDQFQHHVLNELCAEIVKSRTRDCNELQQFVQEECTQLKLQVCVDKLNVDNVLMQCVFKTRTVNKSTKEIDDMGYGGEQLLLGGRLFPVLDNSIDKIFKLKVIDDLSQLKIKLDSTLEPDQQTKTICHAVPVRSTRQKLRRADSDSSLC
ncbi:unnamed protein product [Rotaria socialis]|uniref:Uncharacterized protein n=1 Tax=Rotaria socialis TaxID=392032 RepID=A0A817ZRI5_9BILA|nr:unnamed protein product [Rotaria socialis]